MGIKLNSDGRGGELSYNATTHIPAAVNIRPLHDNIIVKPLDINHSDVLVVVEDIKPVRGIVKAVGPGHYPLRYNHPDKSRRTKMWRSTTFLPTQIKVGDIVELGSIVINGKVHGYSFQQIVWGGEMYIVCREADVSGVVEEGDRA